MKFCTKCGTELLDEAVVCIGCGCPVKSNDYFSKSTGNDLLRKLSERTKINGIIWIVISALQIMIGLYGFWVTLVIGVLNIINAVRDINYSRTVMEKPVGIVRAHESLVIPIIVLVYNFIIGGVIGVAGSVYYFVAIRGFVMENKEAFYALENASENADN